MQSPILTFCQFFCEYAESAVCKTMSVQQLTLPVPVQDGLPSGFERLPSAMRPPVAAVVAARAKRHCRAQCYKTFYGRTLQMFARS